MKTVTNVIEKFTICVSTLKSRYFQYLSHEVDVHNEPVRSNKFQISIFLHTSVCLLVGWLVIFFKNNKRLQAM
jgi:hypothetical protein